MNFNRYDKNRISSILVLVLILEFFALPMLHADKLPQTSVTRTPDKNVDFSNIFSPAEQLEHILKVQGNSPEMIEAKSYSDWLMLISSIYTEMGPEAKDVFTFYTALIAVRDFATAIPDAITSVPIFFNLMADCTNVAIMTFALISQTRIGVFLQNIVRGYNHATRNAAGFLEGLNSVKFLEYMYPPEFWNNPRVQQKGMQAYWYWVTKKPVPMNQTLARYQGIARTVGIGFIFLSFVLDSIEASTSENTKAGRYFSYKNVKNGIYALVELGMIAFMFTPPPFGQIAGICCLCWSVFTVCSELAAPQFQRWTKAYKNSFWYLYEKDASFKSFHDSRKALKSEEKSAAQLLTQKRFANALSEQHPTNEEEQKLFEKGKKILESIEQQESLSAYYAQINYSLADFRPEFLRELWKRKASYLAWKPSKEELEAAEKRGIFDSAIQFMNPVKWLESLLDSNSNRKNELFFTPEMLTLIKPVFFNPDYALSKKYLSYIMGKGIKNNPLYELIKLRIEQEPFNYIYLLDIPTSSWDDDIAKQSIYADTFIVGSKELLYIYNLLKGANEQITNSLKDHDLKIQSISVRFIPAYTRIIESLELLLSSFNESKDKTISIQLESRLVNNGIIKSSSLNVDRNAKYTPEYILKHYSAGLKKTLIMLATTLGTFANDVISLDIAIKKNLDMAELLNKFLEDKKNGFLEFSNKVKNEKISAFLKNGDYLDIEGKTFANWVADVYPPYEETSKYLTLIETEVRNYHDAASVSNTSSRKGLIFDYSIKDPDEVFDELCKLIEKTKQLYLNYYEIKDEVGMEFEFPPSDTEMMDKFFPDESKGFKLMFGKDGRKPLDLKKLIK
ncbi:MAG: hypothetical protein HQM10_25900 [Candidatus Riflebacteria bacterium]|nr:hypothetical protein [Candidatus Riflebacteria bacterium]